jgi:hypothetical protein
VADLDRDRRPQRTERDSVSSLRATQIVGDAPGSAEGLCHPGCRSRVTGEAPLAATGQILAAVDTWGSAISGNYQRVVSMALVTSKITPESNRSAQRRASEPVGNRVERTVTPRKPGRSYPAAVAAVSGAMQATGEEAERAPPEAGGPTYA